MTEREDINDEIDENIERICEWKEVGYVLEPFHRWLATECGKDHLEETINGDFVYCPYCGGRIKAEE